ncbi:MAG: hypothetical protein K9J12_18605, partial [Melioribacteraceae bacterium]|nr:hypothetical protein [Melioribacteraceae bacterium]
VNLLHWNGNHFIQMDIPNEVFLAYQNAMWGLSSDDFYVVGNGGNIAHYQNGYWKKIESGTDVDLTDIYGSDDGNYIWTCGWDYQNGQSAIIEIKSSSPRFIWNENTQNTYRGYLNTVWFDNHEFWLGGSEIRRQSPYYSKLGRSIYLTTSTGWKAFSSDEFIFSIRGFARNNVYLGGEDGGLYHFNGISFRKYIELHDSVNRRRIKHLDASINRLIAVGWLDGQAWIIKQPN